MIHLQRQFRGATAVAEYAADGDETDVQEENMVEINETNFPDEVFRNYLTTTFDTDGDGMIDVTQVKGLIHPCIIHTQIQRLLHLRE